MAIVSCARAPLPPTADLARRYPRLAAYLAALPAGLDSYPECQTRGTLAAEFAADVSRGARDLPHEVAQLFAAQPATWIPEAQLAATILAVADHAGRGDDEHAEWVREKNRAVFRGVVYRSLMAFFTPAGLLEKASSRWESFHRGTALGVERLADRHVRARLEFPPHLVSGPLLPRAYGAAMQAALEHSRAKTATLEVEDVGATWVTYRARWT
jgi:hypothetical protein